jgi:hypothetical protein
VILNQYVYIKKEEQKMDDLSNLVKKIIQKWGHLPPKFFEKE